METAETSTVAAALTIKPAVSRYTVIGVVAGVAVGVAVIGVVKWRKARSQTVETVEIQTA